MQVKVCYALPTEQIVSTVELAAGATVNDALQASGILQQFPQIDLTQTKLGIYGEFVNLDHQLRQDDRVEIYRPLTIDPMDARRHRAGKSKVKEPRQRKIRRALY